VTIETGILNFDARNYNIKHNQCLRIRSILGSGGNHMKATTE